MPISGTDQRTVLLEHVARQRQSSLLPCANSLDHQLLCPTLANGLKPRRFQCRTPAAKVSTGGGAVVPLGNPLLHHFGERRTPFGVQARLPGVSELVDDFHAVLFVAQLNCPGFAQQKCVTTWKEERGSFFQVEVVRGDLEDGAGAPRARRAGRAGCRESGVGAGCALGVR